MRTSVYIDAFNLYYGAVKDTPYKWLDLQALCRVMIPLHKTVGVLNPQKIPCKALQGAARFYKHIREAALQASQFPPVLTDRQGTFHKPASW